MAISSTTSGTQAATQIGWQQLKLQQARRNAEQAEQTAQALQSQASQAQRSADQAQEAARSITVQSDQATSYAGRARQGVAAAQSVGQMQTQISNVVDQVTAKQQAAAPAAVTPVTASTSAAPAPTPVVNIQGQVTGTLINTTA